MTLDSHERALDALATAAGHADAVDRPVLAMPMCGHEVWVVSAGTQLSALLSTYSEVDPERRAGDKRKLLLGPSRGRRLGKPQGFRVMEKEQ
jgi:hypothetical protein